MRQINFVIIFVICLALLLFGLQNNQLVPIRVVEGVQVQAPLSVELLISMGIGAVLAWVFSLWTHLIRLIESGRNLRQRDLRIQELERDVQRYKVELEEQQRLLPAAKPQEEPQDAEVTEIFAQ